MLLPDAVQLLPSSYLNLPSNPLLKLYTAIAIQLTHVVQPYSCSFSAVSLYRVMLKVVVIRYPCIIAVIRICVIRFIQF